jgi:hypothetical protein
VISKKELPPDVVVVLPDLAQNHKGLNARQRHDHEKAAKSQEESKPRAHHLPVWPTSSH